MNNFIAAGSLLGVAVNRNKFSFPVGKVFIETMHPLDFEEFLLAKGKNLLIDEIRDHYNDIGLLSTKTGITMRSFNS